MENDIDEYVVLTINIDDQSDLYKNLLMIINNDRLMMFDNIDSSLTYINSLRRTKIYLILSDTLDKNNVYKFIDNPEINDIYVYSTNTNNHMKNIRCSTINVKQLTGQLRSDIKQMNERWSFEEKSFEKALTFTSEWHHLFLLVVSHYPKNLDKSYQKMYEECRSYYNDCENILRQIDQFSRTYESTNAIPEYTKDSFLYRIVNRGLRTRNMNVIKNFSPFITDLYHQLHEHQRNFFNSNEQPIRAAYRGQYLTSNELESIISICKSEKPFIQLTAFTSASVDPNIALGFITPSPDHIICLFEIIISDTYYADHRHMHCFTQIFANISSFSNMPDEKEILFSFSTYFRIKYVSDPIVESDRTWVFIIVELEADKSRTNSTYFDIVNCIENETNAQVYSDILDILQVNAENEEKFHRMNWQKWWNKFTNICSTDLLYRQSLLATIYDCFTDNKDYLRKAIEIHKNHFSYEFNSLTPFSKQFDLFKGMLTMPSRAIAFYEKYLKEFCTSNSQEVIKCLDFAGTLYKQLCDNEYALESYQLILRIDPENRYKMNTKAQEQIKQLNRIEKPKNKQYKVENKNIPIKDNQRIYQVQEEQWNLYRSLTSQKNIKDQKKANLEELRIYLLSREQWYMNIDLKILLRLPISTTEDTSIEYYRFYSLLAIRTHLMCTDSMTDSTNNCSLSFARYNMFMTEWMLFKRLETFLKRYQYKSNLIRLHIIPQLEQVINKLTVLIVVCIAYICINPNTGEVNVHNIRSLNTTNTYNKQQLVFFDLNDKNLLVALEALQEEIQTSPLTFTLPSDAEEFLNAYT